MKSKLLREITPLTQSDCFTLFSREKKEFDFPLHYHDEFELNFIQHAAGAKRIIGLKVSGAFHSPLMAPAVPALQEALTAAGFRDPAFPVIANASATAVSTASAASTRRAPRARSSRSPP